MSPAERRYTITFLLAMVGYALLLFASVLLIDDAQPLWLRATVVLVVVLVLAALAWFGYTAATAVKSRVAGQDASAEDTPQ